jgi:transposase
LLKEGVMDFEKEAAAFRAAVRQAGKRGAGRRYPVAVRRQGAAYLAARRAGGAAVSVVTRELAVRRDTLLGWARPAAAPAKARFLPVAVVEERAGRIVVHGPHGVRVEGLDLAGVAELLRRLA